MSATFTAGTVHPFDPRLWASEHFRAGVRDMAKASPAMAAWGLVTGVAMVKGGLPLGIALGMSLLVFAASAQLAAMPLMLAGAPWWVVILAALCVNLRFVIFSAQSRKHLTAFRRPWCWLAGYLTADITYVMFQRRHGDDEPAGPAHLAPLSYFVGLSVVNWSSWNVASLAGVLLAARIPVAWGMGFAGTLALLALLVSLVKDRRTALTACVAAGTAVVFHALPFKLAIVLAVVVAVAVGLFLDRISPATSGATVHGGRS